MSETKRQSVPFRSRVFSPWESALSRYVLSSQWPPDLSRSSISFYVQRRALHVENFDVIRLVIVRPTKFRREFHPSFCPFRIVRSQNSAYVQMQLYKCTNGRTWRFLFLSRNDPRNGNVIPKKVFSLLPAISLSIRPDYSDRWAIFGVLDTKSFQALKARLNIRTIDT